MCEMGKTWNSFVWQTPLKGINFIFLAPVKDNHRSAIIAFSVGLIHDISVSRTASQLFLSVVILISVGMKHKLQTKRDFFTKSIFTKCYIGGKLFQYFFYFLRFSSVDHVILPKVIGKILAMIQSSSHIRETLIQKEMRPYHVRVSVSRTEAL